MLFWLLVFSCAFVGAVLGAYAGMALFFVVHEGEMAAMNASLDRTDALLAETEAIIQRGAA